MWAISIMFFSGTMTPCDKEGLFCFIFFSASRNESVETKIMESVDWYKYTLEISGLISESAALATTDLTPCIKLLDERVKLSPSLIIGIVGKSSTKNPFIVIVFVFVVILQIPSFVIRVTSFSGMFKRAFAIRAPGSAILPSYLIWAGKWNSTPTSRFVARIIIFLLFVPIKTEFKIGRDRCFPVILFALTIYFWRASLLQVIFIVF